MRSRGRLVVARVDIVAVVTARATGSVLQPRNEQRFAVRARQVIINNIRVLLMTVTAGFDLVGWSNQRTRVACGRNGMREFVAVDATDICRMHAATDQPVSLSVAVATNIGTRIDSAMGITVTIAARKLGVNARRQSIRDLMTLLAHHLTGKAIDIALQVRVLLNITVTAAAAGVRMPAVRDVGILVATATVRHICGWR